MNCKDQNQDLLLLVHWALSPTAAIKSLAHLVVCRSCRAKYSQLRRTSLALINMNGSLQKGALLFPRLSHLAAASGLIVAIAVVGGIAYVSSVRSCSVTNASRTSPVNCIPGLPNDRCR